MLVIWRWDVWRAPGSQPMADALGLEPGVVRLVDYDARWPTLFAAEAARIRSHSRALTLRLEHVGGTSIPGMCAKPVLDIAAAHPRAASIEDYVAAFARAGYQYRGERGLPGRHYFCRGQPRAYHVHLVEADGHLWRDYIAFRDYLRTHGDVSGQFAEVKRVLAARFGQDREAYTEAKSPHVQDILRLARGAV